MGAIVALAGCDGARADAGEPLQGVVELEEVHLAFELGGRIAEIPAREGARVEEGAPLAHLDETLERLSRDAHEAELRAASAQLDLLRAGVRREDIRALSAQITAAREREELITRNLARQRTLAAQGASATSRTDELETQLAAATSERDALNQQLRAMRAGARAQEIEAAEARVEAARTAVAAIDQRLARHVLRAPHAGTVLEVHPEAGEVVAPGAPVVTIADTRRPYVEVFVPQDRIDAVRVGQRARVRVDALEQPLGGAVENISRRTEFTPRFLFSEQERPNLVIRVRIRVDDPEERLHAGVPAFVTLDGGPS